MNYKLTLMTGKVIVVREMQIRDFNLAAEIAGKAGNNTAVSMQLTNELMKMIIVSVDAKVLKPQDKEVLDSLMTVAEYVQLRGFIEESLGNAQKPTVEMLPT